jgi:hypothetical protein
MPESGEQKPRVTVPGLIGFVMTSRSGQSPPPLKAEQQLRQLRHIDRDPPRLIFGE